MYTLANKPYILNSGHRVSLFFDRLDDNFRKLKEERFLNIRDFMTEKISHMPDSRYYLTPAEKDVMETMLQSLFAIKEQLQDSDQ